MNLLFTKDLRELLKILVVFKDSRIIFKSECLKVIVRPAHQIEDQIYFQRSTKIIIKIAYLWT